MKTIRWIGDVTGRQKWAVAALSLVQSLQALCGIFFALVMRRAVDSAVAGEGMLFRRYIVAMILVIVIQVSLRAVNRFLDERTRASIENRFRQRAFRDILHQEYKDISASHSGELMNRITSDTAVISDGVVSMIPSLTAMLLRIVGVLIVLYTISPLLVFIFLVGGVCVVLISMSPRKWLKRLHKRVQEADGDVRSFLQECLESLLVIQTFGCEDKMEKKAGEAMENHKRMRLKKNNVSNFFSTGLGVAMQGGYTIGFVWCGYGILQGSITYGTLTAVIQLIGQIQTPFVNIGGTLPKISALLASGERLMELEEKAERLRKKQSHVNREQLYQQMEAICFEHVTFSYEEEREILSDETFSIEKGEFVALAGASGIGKSTLMKLLLSVYEPDVGEIVFLMGDKRLPVSEIPADMFAYVPQGNHLMSGTIYEVVGFAEKSPCIDREKVKLACETACAREFIEELPAQYETVLGEKGFGLSEGQMQRLAVARAVYSGSPILLLDEATSALDVDTERKLMAALRELPDRTVLLVTHRQEIFGLCDRILERKEP